MKYPLIFLVLITALGVQILKGQSTNRIIQPWQLHQISGTDYTVKIPLEFTASDAHMDEFIFQEKGSVIRFVHIQDVPVSQFLDSMTLKYFEAQKLREVTESKIGEITNFRGKFNIDQVPYIRSFYVIPYNGNTILGIANYPEKIGEELENHYKNMFKHGEHE